MKLEIPARRSAMANVVKCVVDDPPIFSLPYLVVLILPDGTTRAWSFPSEKDAEAFAVQIATQEVGSFH
jgi:hypothetical protein